MSFVRSDYPAVHHDWLSITCQAGSLLTITATCTACKQAVVRDKSTTDSKKLGILGEGQRIKVVSSRERDGVERCKIGLPADIKGERGWVSLVAKDGTVLMVEEQEWAPSGTDEINREWVECETL